MSVWSSLYLYEVKTWKIYAEFASRRQFINSMGVDNYEQALERVEIECPGLDVIDRAKAATMGIVPLAVDVSRNCSYATNGVLRSTEEVELIEPNESLIEQAIQNIAIDLEFLPDDQILSGYTSKSFLAKRMGEGILDWVEIEVITGEACEEYRNAEGELDLENLVMGEFQQVTGEMSVISVTECV